MHIAQASWKMSDLTASGTLIRESVRVIEMDDSE